MWPSLVTSSDKTFTLSEKHVKTERSSDVLLLDKSIFGPHGSDGFVQSEPAEELQADCLKGRLKYSSGTTRVCRLVVLQQFK